MLATLKRRAGTTAALTHPAWLRGGDELPALRLLAVKSANTNCISFTPGLRTARTMRLRDACACERQQPALPAARARTPRSGVAPASCQRGNCGRMTALKAAARIWLACFHWLAPLSAAGLFAVRRQHTPFNVARTASIILIFVCFGTYPRQWNDGSVQVKTGPYTSRS